MFGVELSPTVVACIVGIGVGIIAYYWIQKRKYRLPPGPWGLPIIGSLLEFGSGKMHLVFERWANKYGPIYTVRVGVMGNWVILNNIELVLEALVKKQAEFAGRPKAYSLELFSDGYKSISLGQYGPTWKLHRKIASKALRTYLQGQQLEQKIHKSVGMVVNEMKKDMKKGPFDPTHHLSLAVFNILCAVCFQKSHDLKDEEFLGILKLDNDLIEVFGNGLLEDVVPLLKYWPTARFRKVMTMGEDVKKWIHGKFQSHLDTFDPDNIRDLTDSLIKCKQEAEVEEDKELLDQLTDTHLVQTLIDVFFAGFDTSRITLYWVFLQMAAYPDIQEKCYQEIKAVVGHTRFPGIEDRSKLAYCEATLHESMRIMTIIPIGVPHTALCDSTIGGFDIPEGTTIVINHWALHHDPNHWENVNSFIPERYLEDGKLGPKPESWLPFSAGRRVCLGESVAKPELHLVFACLLQTFKVSLPSGVTADLEPTGSIGGYIPKPYQLVFEER